MNAKPDKIEKSIEIEVPKSRVWDAISDYKQFGEWFQVALDQPFEEGKPSTGKMTHPGVEGEAWIADVVSVKPETYLSMTWNLYDPDSELLSEDTPTTLVEFILEDTPNGTKLTIIESGFAAIADPLGMDAMRRNTQGWEYQINNIINYVNERTS